MKNLLLAFLFVAGAMVSNAQEISSEQWSLVTKKTADWCPNCGTWGWTFKDYVLEDTKDMPVVFWMAHHSGGLSTPTSEAIVDNFPSSGQPRFFINNDEMGVFSSNINDKRGEFQLLLESLGGFEPFGGVGSTAVFDGEKITNTAKGKFFVSLEGGDYWLASYLVDDVLVAYQASKGDNAEHENILLHSFNGENYFGENISTGAVTADQEFIVNGELDFSGDTDIPNYANGYSVVTVMWALVGDVYTPLNLNRQPITAVVGTNDILDNISISAFHSNQGTIDLGINSDIDLDNVSISLFDMNGRTITSKTGLAITEGKNQMTIDSPQLPLGTYVVNIQSEKGNRSIKIAIRQ